VTEAEGIGAMSTLGWIAFIVRLIATALALLFVFSRIGRFIRRGQTPEKRRRSAIEDLAAAAPWIVAGVAVVFLHYISPRPQPGVRMMCVNGDFPRGPLGIQWGQDSFLVVGFALALFGAGFVVLGVLRVRRLRKAQAGDDA
jgi:hypothetical protein